MTQYGQTHRHCVTGSGGLLLLAQIEGDRRSGIRATPTFFESIHDVSFGMQVLFRTVEALSSR